MERTAQEDAIRRTIDRIPAGVCVFRQRQGEIRCVCANARCAEMLGAAPQALAGETLEQALARMDPEDRAHCRSEFVAPLFQNRPTRGVYRLFQPQQGAYRWVRLEGQPSFQPGCDPCAYVSCTDVTEQVQAQDALEQSRQTMNSVLRYAPGGVFVYSAEEDEQFSFISEHMLAMLGYTAEEFRRKFNNRFSCMIYAEDRDATLRSIWEQIAGSSYDTCFYRIEKKDGTLMWVHDEGHLITDGAGRRWFYVVIVDITDSEKAKSSLASQNDQLRRIIDSIPARIIVLQKKGADVSVIAANGYASAPVPPSLFSPGSLTKDHVLSLAAPEDGPAVLAFFQRLFSGQVRTDELTYRVCDGAYGSWKWSHCSALSLPQQDGSVLVYAVYTDATLQKRREDDFNRIIQELLTANPNSLCAFRLNLTQNLCSDGHGISEYTRQLLEAHTADELIGRIVSIIPDPAQAAAFRAAFSREQLLKCHAAGEDRRSMTYRRRTDSGESHWVTTLFHVLQNPYTGDIEAIACSVDSDHAHKEERIISLITEEEYDGIGLIEAETGRVSYYYLAGSGYLAAEKLPKLYADMVAMIAAQLPQGDAAQGFSRGAGLDAIRARLETEPVYRFSASCRTRQGAVRRKQVTYRYLEADRREIMFALSDITESFEREEAYAEQLRKALLDAKKANEMKTDFLGNVSHDMRTPLNAILGYDRLALQAQDVPPQIRDYLRKIETAGDTLLTLINDTLDLQKIETGAQRMNPTPIACSALVQDIVTSVQPSFDKKHIHFEIDNRRAVMATVNVDVLCMREIFINLLSNAAKYTPEGGRVSLIIECLALEEHCLHDRITVQDSGIGMSPAFLEKMYEPFTQERTRKTAHIGGSGLGLAIVKRTVERLGGRIEVTSEPGRGTAFSVYLDLERLDAGQPEPPAGDLPLTGIRGLHILLCEDNEMNTEIARQILESCGAAVVAAADGAEGCRQFLASPPGAFDAILMDIRMPNLDGYAATERIRACGRPDAASVPILAMSADAYSSDVEKALQSGMNGHIAKPIDPARLIAELSKLTAARQK
jgi:PAS domain S-box-containing protein